MNINELKALFNDIISACGFENEFSISVQNKGEEISIFALSEKTNTSYVFSYNVCAYILTCDIADSKHIKNIDDQSISKFFYDCSINQYRYVARRSNNIESSLYRFFYDLIRGNKIGILRKGWSIETPTIQIRTEAIKALTCFYELNCKLCSIEALRNSSVITSGSC